jgi:hypothetical protein
MNFAFKLRQHTFDKLGLSPFLLGLSACKYAFGSFVYCNALFPLCGLLFGIKSLADKKEYWPLLFACAINFSSCFMNHAPGSSYLRLLQLVLIIAASSFVATNNPRQINWIITRVVFPIVLFEFLFYIVSWICGDNTNFRYLFGFLIPVPRHVGLAGDPNFSAVLYSCMSYILFLNRPSKSDVYVGLILAFISLFAFSRSSFLMHLVFLIGFSLSRIQLKYYCYAMIAALFAFPFVLGLSSNTMSVDHKINLTKSTSTRYPFWIAYIKASHDKPLGYGYFNSKEHSQMFVEEAILDDPRSFNYYDRDKYISNGVAAIFIEQHCWQVQVLSDFGLVGYVFFWMSFLTILQRAVRKNPHSALLMICSFTGYTFINALSEWGFWFTIATVIVMSESLGMNSFLSLIRLPASPPPLIQRISPHRQQHTKPRPMPRVGVDGE